MGHAFRNAPSLHVIAMHPWIPLLRGFWVLILGELTLFMPDMTLKIFAILFAIYALVDGTFVLAAALRTPGIRPTFWLALIGVSGILIGLCILLSPGLSAHALYYCIAVWAIALGLGEIAGALALRKFIANEWFCLLGGGVALVFALLVMYRTVQGALAPIWFVSGFAIIFGILQMAAAYELRRHIVGSAHSIFLGDLDDRARL